MVLLKQPLVYSAQAKKLFEPRCCFAQGFRRVVSVFRGATIGRPPRSKVLGKSMTTSRGRLVIFSWSLSRATLRLSSHTHISSKHREFQEICGGGREDCATAVSPKVSGTTTPQPSSHSLITNAYLPECLASSLMRRWLDSPPQKGPPERSKPAAAQVMDYMKVLRDPVGASCFASCFLTTPCVFDAIFVGVFLVFSRTTCSSTEPGQSP